MKKRGAKGRTESRQSGVGSVEERRDDVRERDRAQYRPLQLALKFGHHALDLVVRFPLVDRVATDDAPPRDRLDELAVVHDAAPDEHAVPHMGPEEGRLARIAVRVLADEALADRAREAEHVCVEREQLAQEELALEVLAHEVPG